MKQSTFGEALELALRMRGWSAARLAKEINLDSSYIRRWIRGDRVPSLHSGHAGWIAQALAPGFESDSARQALHDRFLERGFTAEEASAVGPEGAIGWLKRLLEEAQVHALKLPREDRLQWKRESGAKANMDGIVAEIGRLSEALDNEGSNGRASEPNAASWDRPAIRSFSLGREQTLTTIVSLLEQSLVSDDGPLELLYTFQSENGTFEGYPSLAERWRQGIVEALRRGGRVRPLIKLNKNTNRSVALISDMIAYLGRGGGYEPRYFARYGIYEPPREIFGVAGSWMLVCLSSEQTGSIDSAFLHRDKQECEAIAGHFEQLAARTEPLLRYYSEEQYFEENTKKDRKKGNLLVNNRDLGAMTLPLELWETYLRRSLDDDTAIKRHMERISERMKHFLDDSQSTRIIHVCPMAAIEHLLFRGEYYASNRYRKPAGDDGIRHIEHLIVLLKTLKHYELSLVSEEQSRSIPLSYWDVKDDHTVTFGIPHTGQWTETYVVLTEGTLASAFGEYFHQIRQLITPKYRDKKEVIAWLESRLTEAKLAFGGNRHSPLDSDRPSVS
ncbi:multiprotein-bridging factor 1 family protein [Cohnella suwonensis]|uniref:Multiprotein-bridging factor 1 family protein n=1 Tax=Cohnella suwonensis TaxID=696072 RepID=A0ABW0LZR8_9BACL